MTLSSAYWALASLAAKDETVRKTSQAFLDADPRVKAIEQNEQDAFAAYLERLSAWTAAKGDPDSPTRRSRRTRSFPPTKTSARPGTSCTRWSWAANRSSPGDRSRRKRPAPRVGAPARL